MKLDANSRELYLLLLAVEDKLNLLNALPTPIGDNEKREYLALHEVLSNGLSEENENARQSKQKKS